MKRVMVGLLALMTLGGLAQPLANDPEATTVEEFVVRGRLPGPAWWKVSDGDSTVYILGIPDALPKGQAWDQSVLRKRLQGANGLITPSVVQAGGNALAFPVLKARFDKAAKLETGLQASLGPDRWARLERAAGAAGRKPARYAKLKPWFAGVKLSSDFRQRAGLDYDEPLRTVRKAAQKAKVKATPAYVEKTKVDVLLGQLETMSPEIGDSCLNSVLSDVEAGAGWVRRTGKAWAVGDVAGALAAPRTSSRCWTALPGAGRMVRGSHADQAGAIAAALRKPGHTVAVLYMRPLVAQSGVLDQLRAKGFKVEAPE